MRDMLIKNGLIVDGSGAKPYSGSLYIRDGKIEAVGPDVTANAAKVIDAAGMAVAPGFIDIHTHSDTVYRTVPDMNSKLVSGVTTEVVGQCGGSCIPIRDGEKDWAEKGIPYDLDTYIEDVRRRGVSINLGMMIGHGTLRAAVVGLEMRQATPDELERMCALLEKMLLQGALGVTFGLIYPPGSFCDTAEIIALAKVCAKYDRVLSVHIRNENKGAFDALEEMIRVGEQTGVKIEISHFKLMGKAQWGRIGEQLAKVDAARKRGVRIGCDQYPYTASSSGLLSCFPKWAMDGGFSRLYERLQDETEWAKVSEGGFPEMYERGGPENIIIQRVPTGADTSVQGKSLTELAEEWKLSVPETMRRLLLRSRGGVNCFYHSIGEADMLQVMARRDVSVVSDGTAFDLDSYTGLPHPRSTGTAPRFLRLVREHGLMPLEDAVRKLTGLPAGVMGLDGTLGLLREGLDGTVVIFDPDTVADRATFREPNLRPVGIGHVIVSGETVLEHGVPTAARPGRVLTVGRKEG